jgi:hypothetical protein
MRSKIQSSSPVDNIKRSEGRRHFFNILQDRHDLRSVHTPVFSRAWLVPGRPFPRRHGVGSWQGSVGLPPWVLPPPPIELIPPSSAIVQRQHDMCQSYTAPLLLQHWLSEFLPQVLSRPLVSSFLDPSLCQWRDGNRPLSPIPLPATARLGTFHDGNHSCYSTVTTFRIRLFHDHQVYS